MQPVQRSVGHSPLHAPRQTRWDPNISPLNIDIAAARIFAVGSGYHPLKRENWLTLFLTPITTINPYHFQVFDVTYSGSSIVVVGGNIRGHKFS